MSLMQVLTTRDTFQTTTTPYAFLGSSATFLPDSRDITSSSTSATPVTDTFSSYFPSTRERSSLLSSNDHHHHHLLGSNTPATTTTSAAVEDLKLSNSSNVDNVNVHKDKPATATWSSTPSSQQQDQHSMNNLQHVAQQSRREKLRIPGSPSHSEHAGESLESPGMRSYGANPGTDMLSVYNNQLLAPELYSYTTGSELMNAVSGKNQGYLIAGTDGLSQVYSAPGAATFQTGNVNIPKGGGAWNQFNANSLNVTVPPTSSAGIPGALLVGSGLQSSASFGSTTGRDLGAYFTGGAGNAQDAMQLYLMNAAGFSSYPDSSTGGGGGGSMVFIPGPSNASQQLGGNGGSAQNLINSHVGSVSGSSPVGYSQGGRAYTGWKNGDELVFMPGSERAKSLIGSSQEEFSAAEYGLRDASLAGQHVDNSQRLSLTLSSQQPALHAYDVLQQSGLDSPVGLSQDGKRTGKLGADLSHFRADFQGKQMQQHLDSSTSAMSASFNIISNSRYLKACQQLLEEVCSVGKGVKPGGKGSSKGWTGASPLTSPTSVTNKDGGTTATATTTTTTTTRGEEEAKDGGNGTAAATAPTSVGTAGTASGNSGAAAGTTSGAGGAAASCAGEGGESTSALGVEEKQDLETKKSKLVAMLQEVDRRYRQYYDQMQVVISSFDAVAGVGAATPYTALALQAMSRYFRCLKDAITGQISLVCKSLGEEDISKQITTKSPTSRLRFIDQQIRQQRAFQQLGMLNQHAWRPQRGLPERSVSILRAWLFEHFLHPYPKDADKMMLARQTGLTRSQVSNWFINARVRLWKPMVEEMYQEETREHELDIAVSRLNAAAAESDADGNTTSVNTATTAANANNEMVTLTSNDYPKSTSSGQFGHETSAGDSYLNPGIRKQSLTSDSSQLYDETSQQMKKTRYTTSGLHETDHMLTSSMDVDLKPGADDGLQESHHQLANGALQHHHFGYDHSQLRFPNGTAAGFRYNLNPGGVSLTLGLQHSDGLAAQQQAYLQGGQGGGGAAAGFHLTSRRDSGSAVTTEHDFSSLYENAAAAAAGLHDGMSYSSRKHMESQLLHDFVPS